MCLARNLQWNYIARTLSCNHRKPFMEAKPTSRGKIWNKSWIYQLLLATVDIFLILMCPCYNLYYLNLAIFISACIVWIICMKLFCYHHHHHYLSKRLKICHQYSWVSNMPRSRLSDPNMEEVKFQKISTDHFDP